MRVLGLFVVLFVSIQTASAKSKYFDPATLVNLGNGIFLEVPPPVYASFTEGIILEDVNNYYEEWSPPPDSFKVKAIPDLITSDLITYEAHYSELLVYPATLADDGSTLEPALAFLVEVSGATRVATHDLVKMPAALQLRTVPMTLHRETVRKKVNEPVFIFRDEAGKEITRYEDVADAKRYIESLGD